MKYIKTYESFEFYSIEGLSKKINKIATINNVISDLT
jgi:hypothetical protein